MTISRIYPENLNHEGGTAKGVKGSVLVMLGARTHQMAKAGPDGCRESDEWAVFVPMGTIRHGWAAPRSWLGRSLLFSDGDRMITSRETAAEFSIASCTSITEVVPKHETTTTDHKARWC